MPIFSYCAVSLGVCTALLGPFAERWGPRATATIAGLSYCTALSLSAYGASIHSLPVIAAGYGVFGGIGWGLGYISPVSTLMRWFPDRRGFATGLALTAFGGGAMLAAPATAMLYDYFFVLPDYLGTVESVKMVTEEGKKIFAVISYQEIPLLQIDTIATALKDE